jgi:hypothetical protein
MGELRPLPPLTLPPGPGLFVPGLLVLAPAPSIALLGDELLLPPRPQALKRDPSRPAEGAYSVAVAVDVAVVGRHKASKTILHRARLL